MLQFYYKMGNIHMRIGICDDDVDFVIKVNEWLRKNYTKIASENIHRFYCGEALMAFLNTNNLDILFLDCDLDSMNGIEIANSIHARNSGTLIIAVSNFVEYAVYGYGSVFRYIEKKRFESRVPAIFAEAVREFMSANQDSISVKIKSGIHRFMINDIVYIESDKRRLALHLRGGAEHVCYGKLDDFAKQLAENGFIRTHSSYLVNCKYITRFVRGGVTLFNGETVPVSQGKYSSALDSFTLYAKGEFL